MFETADILLTTSKTTIGRVIVWILRFFQKDQVFFNHCILVANNKFGIEAATAGIQYCDLKEKMESAEAFKLIRCKCISNAKKESIVKSTRKLVGLSYGFKRLILQLLDQMFRTDFFTCKLGDNRCQVCSSLIAWAYYTRCKIRFNGIDWQSCEPDDIDDFSEKRPDLWEIIFDSGGDKKCL
jgi:hypothetical protein